VTPFNSGLSNSQFLQAAVQVGAKNIVFPALPSSPNTPIVNTLNSSIVEITRLNNDCFYDVSSPSTGVYGSWADEYNATYGPNGVTPVYSQNQTYSQILNTLSESFLTTNILSYAPYPIEFHIANTATYDGTNSIYSDLMNKTIAEYESLFKLPVLSLNIENIGALLTARAKYNSSGVVGVYTPGVSVVLTTTNAASIPVTGICSQTSCGTYGGQIQDNVVMAANSTVTIPLTSNVGVSLSSIGVSPASVTSGTSATGTVTLSGAAPTGGVPVSLASNNAAAIVPASVTVAAGGNSATYTVTTGSVASSVSATLTASYSGVSKTAALTITPATSVALSSVSLNPTSVASYAPSTGTVTLNSAAPTGGVSISLSSNNAAATVPASVTVAAGSTTAAFTIATSSVSSTTSVTITAAYNSVSKTAALSVTPAATVTLSSVSISPTSVVSQLSATGTVTISAAAPAGGIVVALWTTGTVAFVPASVTIPAGSKTATFTITTNYTTSTLQDTVTAFYNGASTTAGITVTP
jgi:hypothetical protein